MKRFGVQRAVLVLAILLGACKGHLAFADGDINKVNHVIVLMQQGHSFDNYFGALAYARGVLITTGTAPVILTTDSLTCAQDASGNLSCSNQNVSLDGSIAFSFHQSQRCVAPAPTNDPSWYYTHLELNFNRPDRASSPRNNGFLLAKSLTELMGGTATWPRNLPLGTHIFPPSPDLLSESLLPFGCDFVWPPEDE